MKNKCVIKSCDTATLISVIFVKICFKKHALLKDRKIQILHGFGTDIDITKIQTFLNSRICKISDSAQANTAGINLSLQASPCIERDF